MGGCPFYVVRPCWMQASCCVWQRMRLSDRQSVWCQCDMPVRARFGIVCLRYGADNGSAAHGDIGQLREQSLARCRLECSVPQIQ